MSVNINEITHELHKAFEYINRDFFDNTIKTPALTIQTKGNRKNILGWCTTSEIWRNGEINSSYEINIVAEYLDRGYEAVITTLIHEMIHLFNIQNNIKDVSRGGQYHNKKFKQKAEEIGFKVSYDDIIGFSSCTLSEHMKEIISKYDVNKELFNIARYSLDVEIAKIKKRIISNAKENGSTQEEIDKTIEKLDAKYKKNKKGGYIKYKCPCCNTTIRATKKIKVMCVDCNVSFVED